MKMVLDNQTKLIATKGNRGEINYYIITPDNKKLYAFTKNYYQKTWDLCKSGIRVNDLMKKRAHHEGIMLLVKYTKYIMPYLCEEYGLAVA